MGQGGRVFRQFRNQTNSLQVDSQVLCPLPHASLLAVASGQADLLGNVMEEFGPFLPGWERSRIRRRPAGARGPILGRGAPEPASESLLRSGGRDGGVRRAPPG